jgi:hypothetical protein
MTKIAERGNGPHKISASDAIKIARISMEWMHSIASKRGERGRDDTQKPGKRGEVEASRAVRAGDEV